MFLNLTPYLTWLGIMLTSKPNDLQTRINNLRSPTPPGTSPTTPTTPPTTTIPIGDLFICTGRPVGRYPHSSDCSKYFRCTGQHEIVRPTSCPRGLHFSPIVLLCTVPRDAGCTVETTTTRRPGTNTTRPTPSASPPIDSSWLIQIQLARYFQAVNEDRLVIYFDHDVSNPASVLWPISFIRNMWDSVTTMYGNFGPDNRLYLLLRGRPQSESLNYAGFLDSSKGNINAIEIGSSNWSVENSTNTDLITRNIAHIIVENARGIRYPGREPNWVDIFVYDLYRRASRTLDGNRWVAQMQLEADSNIGSIPLFGEWYLPIYQSYGGGATLNRFFIVREQNFPKSENGQTFARQMNRGEFIHFWSGVTGENLTSTATSVFGWNTALGQQYQQAIADFRNLSY